MEARRREVFFSVLLSSYIGLVAWFLNLVPSTGLVTIVSGKSC